MDEGCCRCERQEKYVQMFGKEIWRKETTSRPGLRWEDSIKLNFKEIIWMSLNWVHVAEGRGQWQAVVDTVMNLVVP
jgi:hypothetical protein